MISITLAGCQWEVVDGVGPVSPVKILTMTDPKTGIAIRCPFDLDPAKKVGAALMGIERATVLPDSNGHAH